MGKVQELSLLSSNHNSSRKATTKHSANESVDKLRSTGNKKVKKRNPKSMKWNNRSRLKPKNKHQKCTNESNSLKLTTSLLRDAKRVDPNWEKLSKVLGINTYAKFAALPCEVDYSKTEYKEQKRFRIKSIPRENNDTNPSNSINTDVVLISNKAGGKADQVSSKSITQIVQNSSSSDSYQALGNVKEYNGCQSKQHAKKFLSKIGNISGQDKCRFQNAGLTRGNVHQPELLTKVVAMDCEMVGVGENGKDSNLARISIVNANGECVYDKFVHPVEVITDYRTPVSGVHPEDLKNAEALYAIQEEVIEILKGRILVGHSLKNDFNVLFLGHPRHRIRDTSKFSQFRAICGGRTPSLKKLAYHFLQMKIQTGEHSSVEDAQAAMQLYQMFRKDWECSRNKKLKKKKAN